jgi:hypothetical protein
MANDIAVAETGLAPIVEIAAGKLRGASSAGIYSFKDIPYGASTVGRAGQAGIAGLFGAPLRAKAIQVSEIRAASSWAPGAPAVVSATSVLSKTKGRSIAWCASRPTRRV